MSKEKLVLSLVAMAAADGRVGKRERRLLELMTDAWGVPRAVLDGAIAEVATGKKRLSIPRDPAERRALLKGLVKVAAVDGVIEPGERKMLDAVAARIEVSPAELEEMLQRALRKQSDRAARARAPEAPAPAPPPQPIPLGMPTLAPPGPPEPEVYIRPDAHYPPTYVGAQGQHLVGAPGGNPFTGKFKLIAAGVIAACYLVLPLFTGVVGGFLAVGDAEDRAIEIEEPDARAVEGERDTYKGMIEVNTKQLAKLEQELAKHKREVESARTAPRRLLELKKQRIARQAEFERAFPAARRR